ncbi:hypothetical protein JQC72_04505 [Polycladomyces sp. WAk]|uniref:Uncharacterized protein n=1 Tax=Polycladomyces zharkentensis TaxID=2807616 RepID=A0ABS2WH18_9BACL|nr:hypothetical protein [Polycladomyces sp. WAk]MBN2908783.1 hypothetical protein [Polycladomyces sp. WAk]
MVTLFEECIHALGENCKVLSKEETNRLFSKLGEKFPFTSWGRIDWEKVDNRLYLASSDEIIRYFKRETNPFNGIVYIIWDEAALPAVKSDLQTILQVIDDVTAVSFDTWLYCPSDEYVIEFYHEGEIVLGMR